MMTDAQITELRDLVEACGTYAKCVCGLRACSFCERERQLDKVWRTVLPNLLDEVTMWRKKSSIIKLDPGKFTITVNGKTEELKSLDSWTNTLIDKAVKGVFKQCNCKDLTQEPGWDKNKPYCSCKGSCPCHI